MSSLPIAIDDKCADMGTISYLDLKRINDLHKEDISAAINQVLESGRYLLGDALREFEHAYAQYIGTKQRARSFDPHLESLPGNRKVKEGRRDNRACQYFCRHHTLHLRMRLGAHISGA